MAEVLGIVSSIIGLIQLAGKVTCLGYGYIGGVRRAPEDLEELVQELGSLTKALTILRNYVDSGAMAGSPSVTIEILNSPDGPIQGCAKELEILRSKLDPIGRGGFRGMIESLKWPLKGEETLGHISQIERHKSLFILAFTADNMALSKTIEAHIQNTNLIVKEIEAHVQHTMLAVQVESTANSSQRQQDADRLAAEKRVTVLNWLCPEDPNSKHIEISNRRQKDTGEWLLQTPEWREWADGHEAPQLLLGHGIPGAGKTFLSSVVIDHIRTWERTANCGVAHVYFDYKEQERQTPIYVLSILLKQLATQIAHLPTGIASLYNKLQPKDEKPTLEEVYNALIEASRSFSRVFFVFDALDECRPDTQRRQLLPLFQRMGKDGIRLFLTSRPHPEDIQNALCDAARIELSAQEQDIVAYIEQRINDNPRIRRLIQQAKCKDRVISELVDCAQGMFLLVRFHIEFLCQQTNARQILATLEKLKGSPTGEKQLYPTYDRIIEGICGQSSSTELAFNILCWLAKAKQTLTIEELQTAVAIEHNRYELSELDLADTLTLVDVCAGLVVFDEHTGTVRLAHYTVQEYLQLKTPTILLNAEAKISMACITYLSFDSLKTDYAANQLRYHLNSCDNCDSDPMVNAFLKFIECPGSLSSYLQILYFFDSQHDDYDELDPGVLMDGFYEGRLPLHIASDLGYLACVRLLLEKDVDISARDQDGSTALHLAADEGHQAVVRILLEKGADINAADEHGFIPLHGAAFSWHENISILLIEKGTNIMAQSNTGTTALHLAALRGLEALISLLLDLGADVTAENHDGNTPLHEAVFGGRHEAMTKLLLAGANVSAPNKHGVTPLHRALSPATVGLLLENGADVSAVDMAGDTPLHRAAYLEDEDVVKLLLKAGADISTPNKRGNTPLHEVVQYGDEDAQKRNTDAGMVKLLVENGADVSAPNRHRDTPLHVAAGRGDGGVVRLLLTSAKLADISAPNDRGNTALHLAVKSSSIETASLLLENGAEISAANKEGDTALHWAARSGYEDIVKLLLTCGKPAKISAPNNRGETALHQARLGGHGAVVNLLLGLGVDVS